MMETAMKLSSRSLLSLVIFASILVGTSTGCSTLVGSVKPVDEKSHRYQIAELSPSQWRKLDPKLLLSSDIPDNPEAYSSEVSDVTYQSLKTAAIISLNSACREGRDEVENLEGIANELLLGMSDVTERKEEEIKISGHRALQTTVEGRLERRATRIRTVVLSSGACVYALMYISEPRKFGVHEADFTRFISSLRLR